MTASWDCCLMLLGQGWEMIYIPHAPRTDPTAMTKVMPLGEMLALVSRSSHPTWYLTTMV